MLKLPLRTCSLPSWMSALRAHPACLIALILLLLTGILAGCADPAPSTPTGAFVGRPQLYDYSPSVMQTGNRIQVWWCGLANNPEEEKQFSDTILYEAIDTATSIRSRPVAVLGETPGAWDSTYACNPKVVRGAFINPLGDGITYSYAMYYVGTARLDGRGNSIGVAFSEDGVFWKKYKDPIIVSTSATYYDAGLPVPYNRDGKSSILLLYEDAGLPIEHRAAVSADGLHFTRTGTVTRNGFDPNNPYPSWGDAGYDPVTDSWYATFDLPTRDPSTTGYVEERGQYGFQLWRIAATSLLTGETGWQQLQTFDTNATGFESNFLAGILRDPYGNVNVGSYPKLTLFPSISNPQPAWNVTHFDLGHSGDLPNWDISQVTWDPAVATLELFRVKNQTGYETTTGYVDPFAGFAVDASLGHLYTSPQNGAALALYSCKSGVTDYFVSLDPACDSQHINGLEGYGYATAPANVATVPLYACSKAGLGHFASNDPGCDGAGAGSLVGFALR